MYSLQRIHRLNEAFQYRKFQPGQVNFPSSSIQDPFIQKVVQLLAHANNVTPQQIEQAVEHKVAERNEQAVLIPLLHGTMMKNAVENEVFDMFWNGDVPVNGPKFNTTTFYKLVRAIRADHDEFFPLRGFIDKRRLQNPQYSFVDENTDKKSPYASVNTAAASPNGDFIFNVRFMQKLMDYSHLKQIKPKGSKYISNGGDIPDEYGYIEFLIMHEFMHYSNDDFYYQKIIPKANPKIINWVGDFRTNYLLVKSGYEPLPIGLYNDSINYDRQKSYIEMYNLVKQEIDKLPTGDQQSIGKTLDGMSDDHEPGQQQGKQSDVTPDDATPTDIDENGKKITDQMKRGDDSTPEQREQKAKEDAEKAKQAGNQPQKSRNPDAHAVDYSQIRPTFNWQTLMKKFIQSAMPKFDTTYAKPARRTATGLDIIRQTGSSAVKPGEKQMDFADMRLGFVIDSSGSMSSIIATVLANSINLLKQPIFAKSQALVMKFSGDFELYKVNFRSNLAAKVSTITEKPKNYPLKTSTVLGTHIGSSTFFSPQLAHEIATAVSQKYNIVMFLDGDILAGSNLTVFEQLLKSSGRSIFVIFDSRETYIQFRQATNFSTPNITHF